MHDPGGLHNLPSLFLSAGGSFRADVNLAISKAKQVQPGRAIDHSGIWGQVDGETLVRLDELEGHPDWYRRVPLSAEVAGREVQAEIYVNDDMWLCAESFGGKGPVPIEDGDYRAYLCRKAGGDGGR
jgi:gamma-glutamylcyclotransferase (GGCT)/AIG2-like uncharacterized protein YtfP